jgi:hypothetical protein
MVQPRRSQVRLPMKSLDFFNLTNPSTSRTMALGFAQPLTEMSSTNVPVA